MKTSDYNILHNMEKQLNEKQVVCAENHEQKTFYGHSVKNNPNKIFKVIQCRKGHKNQRLGYILQIGESEKLVRVDILGKDHKGTPAPHIHIYDDLHENGDLVVPIKNISNYDGTDDIIKSFKQFLDYNNFDSEEYEFSLQLNIK